MSNLQFQQLHGLGLLTAHPSPAVAEACVGKQPALHMPALCKQPKGMLFLSILSYQQPLLPAVSRLVAHTSLVTADCTTQLATSLMLICCILTVASGFHKHSSYPFVGDPNTSASVKPQGACLTWITTINPCHSTQHVICMLAHRRLHRSSLDHLLSDAHCCWPCLLQTHNLRICSAPSKAHKLLHSSVMHVGLLVVAVIAIWKA